MFGVAMSSLPFPSKSSMMVLTPDASPLGYETGAPNLAVAASHSSTKTLVPLFGATAMSGRPSPLKSAASGNDAAADSAVATGAEKVPVGDPLRNAIALGPLVATAISRLPSP